MSIPVKAGEPSPNAQTASLTLRDWVSVLDYGAKGDGRRIKGVKSSTASSEVTVASAEFTADDVGKTAVVYKDFEAGSIRPIAEVLSPPRS